MLDEERRKGLTGLLLMVVTLGLLTCFACTLVYYPMVDVALALLLVGFVPLREAWRRALALIRRLRGGSSAESRGK